jgi:hypothetical protein
MEEKPAEPEEDSTNDDTAAAEASQWFHIKLRNNLGKVFKFRVSKVTLKNLIGLTDLKTSTVTSLLNEYRKKAEMESDAKVELDFDGEAVDEDQTLGDLDVEDEDQMDVRHIV